MERHNPELHSKVIKKTHTKMKKRSLRVFFPLKKTCDFSRVAFSFGFIVAIVVVSRPLAHPSDRKAWRVVGQALGRLSLKLNLVATMPSAVSIWEIWGTSGQATTTAVVSSISAVTTLTRGDVDFGAAPDIAPTASHILKTLFFGLFFSR